MTKLSQKIIPHLWFDNQAEEAANFYTSLFEEAATPGATFENAQRLRPRKGKTGYRCIHEDEEV